MATRKPTAIVAGSLLAGACNPSASPPPVVGSTAPAAADPGREATTGLARDALYHDDFVRRTVYSWTTADQIEELRKGGPLLSREESPANGASYVEQVIHALAQAGDPTAVLLHHAAFAKMRFAWHAPWATRDGWPTEEYGDQLIRITLQPEAIVLALSTATGTFEARDLAGGPVPAATVQARPERIGAIYFVSDAGQPPASGVPAPKSTFREVVLCNEAMIASWAVGADDLPRELDREATALEALAQHLRTRPSSVARPVRDAWSGPAPPVATPEHAFAAALALDSPSYRLDPDTLLALAKRLRATPRPGAPIVGGGTARFAGLGAMRPAPRIVRRNVGSYGNSSWAAPAPPPPPAPVPAKRP